MAVPTVELPDECGLNVGIVITAATPMVEEPEPFPPPSAEPVAEVEVEVDAAADDDEESSLSEQTAVCLREDDAGADAAPHPASSSTASEGESVASGPPTAPQSPPAPRAGRASIPDELEPAQLARLTDLKESNA